MAGSGEKLALSMVIVPRKSEAPSLVCSRDMATPSSLNYCEQSISKVFTSYDHKYGLFAAAQQGKAVLSLKLVWNGVLYLVSGCKATRKHVSELQLRSRIKMVPPLALPRQRKTTNMHLCGWRRMLGLVNLSLLLLLYKML